ncbi:hypothetical protein [Hoeflea sp.]|uniref:hypothetical protein n=1 Tax=Hoeflea sp. TaxID=1940281 RepID=UPI003A954A41
MAAAAHTPNLDAPFDGDPLSGEEIAHEQKVAHLVFSFHKVAVPGGSTAWELSHALLALDHAKKSTRLSSQDRDHLLAAIFDAHSEAVSRLRSIETGRINLGMKAAAGLVIHWSESAVERAARHPHVWIDMHTCARVLRNDCHNLSILEDMAERRRERQVAIVDDLRHTPAAAVS